jgi:hypothetical protein
MLDLTIAVFAGNVHIFEKMKSKIGFSLERVFYSKILAINLYNAQNSYKVM